MASIRPHKGSWYISFRYGGPQFNRSLGVPVGAGPRAEAESRRQAESEKARIELVLRELDRGRKTLPDGADLWEFVRSDGQRSAKPALAAPLNLGKLLDDYFAGQIPGAKAESSLATERVHAKHLIKFFTKSRTLAGITRADLQGYVNARSKAGAGRETVKKELATLRVVWHRGQDAVSYPKLDGTQKLAFPKGGREKSRFRPLAEVQALVAQGGLNQAETKALWESVFLAPSDVERLLEFVRSRRTRSRNAFWYPLLVFVAHTGVRRSEVVRVLRDDIRLGRGDGDKGEVVIRERKRDTTKAETQRVVPLSEPLRLVLEEWFRGGHPDGRYAFCSEPDVPLDVKGLTERWNWLFRESEWSELRGFHVLRHSYASNLAAANCDPGVIDYLMGHTTEAMRKRYRHLFPSQLRQAVDSVYG